MYTYSDILFPSDIPQNTRFFALIGFALNGPVNMPFFIKDGVDPYEVLGDCRLAENYLVAKQNGINPIIVRINGSHGEAVLLHEEKGEPFLYLKTVEARDECNQISIRTSPTHIVVEGLNGKKTYYLKDYISVEKLAEKIKFDMYYDDGEVEVQVLKSAPIDSAFRRDTQYYFSGADDGYNYLMRHDGTDSDEMIQAQLDLLQEKILDIDYKANHYAHASELDIYLIDTVLFTDIPYEREPVRLTEILGKFAESKTKEQCIHCSVVLCSDLFADERVSYLNNENGMDNYTEQISQLLERSSYNIYQEYLTAGESIQYDDEDLVTFDHYLKHIEVVVGIQESINPIRDKMPCAASFAAMRYNLSYHESATNKPLLGVNTLYSNHLLKDEVANLSANGYTLCVPSKINGIVPYSTKSLWPHFNSFQIKPHYMRAVRIDVYRLSRLFDKYIGERTTVTVINSISEKVSELIVQIRENNPIYRNISAEFLDITKDSIRFSIMFELYGEVGAVKTTFEFTPSNEVNIEWI